MGTPYVGQLLLVGFNFAPVNWNLCNGATLPISQYDTLFALIGTTYGGDGQNTFNVPDLRGQVTMHMGTGPGLSPYVIGQRGGVEGVTLTGNQMTTHTHTLFGSTAGATANNPNNAIFAGGGQNKPYSDQAPSSPMNPAMVSQAGGNQPHTNLQPFLACNWIISLFGVFPSQS